MFKRFFLSVSLFLLALMLFAPEVFAARALELNDLRYQVIEEDGRSVLRIEIGMIVRMLPIRFRKIRQSPSI